MDERVGWKGEKMIAIIKLKRNGKRFTRGDYDVLFNAIVRFLIGNAISAEVAIIEKRIRKKQKVN
jgi:hypothetical protein